MNTTIAIHRISGFQARYRAYTVKVDGQNVAKLRNGKTTEIPVAPGRHLLQLSVDWLWTSPEIEVAVTAGDRVELVTRPRPMFKGFWTSKVEPGRYLTLEYSEKNY